MALFKKTVDGIVADITTKIEQLHAVHVAKTAEAKAHFEAMNELVEKRNTAILEATRAVSLAERFTALIS